MLRPVFPVSSSSSSSSSSNGPIARPGPPQHNLKSIETTIAARAAVRDAERDGDRTEAAGAFEMHLSPAGASASVMTLAGAGIGTGVAEDNKKIQNF